VVGLRGKGIKANLRSAAKKENKGGVLKTGKGTKEVITHAKLAETKESRGSLKHHQTGDG